MRCARIGGSCLGLGAVLVLSAGPALAFDEPRLQRFFTLVAADGDGQVSRPEFQAGKGAVFLAIDANGGMTLSPDEMRLSPEGFKLLAGDDGVVDGEEFIAAEVASFDAIDRNRDHQIDFAELRNYVAKYSD
jgi:EF hand